MRPPRPYDVEDVFTDFQREEAHRDVLWNLDRWAESQGIEPEDPEEGWYEPF